MPILGCDECELLRLLADGEHRRVRIDGSEAVCDDGTRIPLDVLAYLRAVTPPLIFDSGTYAEGVRVPGAQHVHITGAGRRALARCDEGSEERTVVVSPEELSEDPD